jgi:hypothetical protein
VAVPRRIHRLIDADMGIHVEIVGSALPIFAA